MAGKAENAGGLQESGHVTLLNLLFQPPAALIKRWPFPHRPSLPKPNLACKPSLCYSPVCKSVVFVLHSLVLVPRGQLSHQRHAARSLLDERCPPAGQEGWHHAEAKGCSSRQIRVLYLSHQTKGLSLIFFHAALLIPRPIHQEMRRKTHKWL